MGYKRASDAYYVPQFTLENRAKKPRSILCRGCSLQDNFFMDVQGEEHCGERIIIRRYGGFVCEKDFVWISRTLSLRNPEKGTAIAFNGAVVEKFLFQSNYTNVHLKVFTTSMKPAWPTNYLPRMF